MKNHDNTPTKKQQARADSIAAMAKLVDMRWAAATSARVEVGQEMILCNRAMLGLPLSGVHVDPEIPVTLNITAGICRGITALMRDAVAAATETMFILEPTSYPTVPPEVSERIKTTLEMALQASVAEGVPLPSDEEFAGEATRLYKEAEHEAMEQARAAARDMTAMVQDRFQENGFRTALSEGLMDLTSSVAMVMKFPSYTTKRVKSWENGRLVFTRQLVRTVERLNPSDFYPAPNSADVQSAEYLMERRVVNAADLRLLATAEGYEVDEVERALTLYPMGFHAFGVDAAGKLLREQTPSGANPAGFIPGHYDIICMHGLVQGKDLIQMGIEVHDELITYEAEIYVIGACVVKAVLNSDPSGRRPYYAMSFDPIPGRVFGKSPATRLFDTQRAITSAYVAMIGDLAASGIYIEVDPSALSEEEQNNKLQLRPRTVRLRKPDIMGTGRKAYTIDRVQSNSPEFRATIDHLHSLAYELVGIPRMAMGQTAGSGTIGRTAGGVASMLNQSSKVLKFVLRQLEEQVIEPIVQAEVDYILQEETPEYIRGDVNVQARGLTGLMEKEARTEDLQWALQSLTSIADKIDPTTGKPLVPATAFSHILAQIFEAKGLDTKGIFSDSESAAEGEAPGGMGQGGSAPMSGMPPPPPALDGRSPQAAAAIGAANNVRGAGDGG